MLLHTPGFVSGRLPVAPVAYSQSYLLRVLRSRYEFSNTGKQQAVHGLLNRSSKTPVIRVTPLLMLGSAAGAKKGE
jgi:hypothetical protein